MHAVADNHDAVEGEARFGTVPGDELVDGVLVDTARGWRAEAVEYGPLTMIQIRQSKQPATVIRLNLVLGHSDGLPVPRHGISAKCRPTANAGTSKIKTSMAKRQGKVRPSWENVKAELARFDRAALLALLQDLYAAAAGNRAFLHARFGLGLDLLQPYKKIMDRWLWPDVFRGEEASVLKAKRAISDYRKASGDADGLAELICDGK